MHALENGKRKVEKVAVNMMIRLERVQRDEQGGRSKEDCVVLLE